MIIQVAELMNISSGSFSFLCSYHPNFAKRKACISFVKTDIGEIFPKHRL